MEKVENKTLLNKYTNETGILNIFSHDMSANIELFSFNKGEFLINEGESSNYLFFLVNGKVKVFSHSSSGKVMFVSHFHSFEVLGETCSLWEKPPTASVKAINKVYCIGISMINHRETLLNDLLFLRYTCLSLAERLSSMTSSTCITLFDSLESRLASFILKNAKEDVFYYNLTECAELLCTSYRHLLRVINSFCSTGKLEKNGKYYKIIDEKYLSKIASNHSNISEI